MVGFNLSNEADERVYSVENDDEDDIEDDSDDPTSAKFAAEVARKRQKPQGQGQVISSGDEGEVHSLNLISVGVRTDLEIIEERFEHALDMSVNYGFRVVGKRWKRSLLCRGNVSGT